MDITQQKKNRSAKILFT